MAMPSVAGSTDLDSVSDDSCVSVFVSLSVSDGSVSDGSVSDGSVSEESELAVMEFSSVSDADEPVCDVSGVVCSIVLSDEVPVSSPAASVAYSGCDKVINNVVTHIKAVVFSNEIGYFIADTSFYNVIITSSIVSLFLFAPIKNDYYS